MLNSAGFAFIVDKKTGGFFHRVQSKHTENISLGALRAAAFLTLDTVNGLVWVCLVKLIRSLTFSKVFLL